MVARFNERFILSLGSCEDCLVLDDELNVLPISKGKDIMPLEVSDGKGKGTSDSELSELKDSLADTKPVGELVKLARTIDQVGHADLCHHVSDCCIIGSSCVELCGCYR